MLDNPYKSKANQNYKSITSVSTTDAVTDRDFAQFTPRRARHTRRWRGLLPINVARLRERKKLVLPLATKCGGYVHLPELVVAQPSLCADA